MTLFNPYSQQNITTQDLLNQSFVIILQSSQNLVQINQQMYAWYSRSFGRLGAGPIIRVKENGIVKCDFPKTSGSKSQKVSKSWRKKAAKKAM